MTTLPMFTADVSVGSSCSSAKRSKPARTRAKMSAKSEGFSTSLVPSSSTSSPRYSPRPGSIMPSFGSVGWR